MADEQNETPQETVPPVQPTEQPYAQQAAASYQVPQQPQYAPPMAPMVESDSTLTMGQWMLNIFLVAIPVVNIIMLFVWGFSASTAPAKKNWARANLIWLAIGIVVYILILVLFGATFLAALSSSGSYY